MQAPPKKKPALRKGGRIILLCALLALIGLGAGLYAALRPEAIPPAQPAASTARQVVNKEAASLAAITVTLRDEEPYTLTYENGSLIYQGGTPFVVDETLAAEILTACTQLSTLDTLAESPEAFGGDWSAFGLEPPRCSVAITYTDGSALTYHIGDRLPVDTGYYFRLEGQNSLCRVHDDLLNTFQVDAGVLYPVEQLRLSQALVDRIALYNGSDDALLHAFEKQADGAFAMTAPVRWPVTAEPMTNILKALANFTLGAYLGPDTPEGRAAQGLEEPQYRLVIHEAAGSAMTTTGSAAQSVTRSARETTLTLWPVTEGSGVCAVNGGLYTFLKLSLAFLYDMDLTEDLLLRSPANLPLEELASLEIRSGESSTLYEILRIPRLTEEGNIQTDSDGNPLCDIQILANGSPVSTEAFAARLERLNSVTVSGRLPEGFTPAEAVTDTLVFTTLSGAVRTVTLAPYDALHSAVGVDGEYLFYLIRGGMGF